MALPLAAIHHPAIDPVAIRLGFVEVRWYGLAYLAGFVLAHLLFNRLRRVGRLSLSSDDVGRLLGWVAAGVLIGGRLGWWVFYHRASGVTEPWYEPVAVWHGGMSFHGGLAGAAAVLLAWCWRHGAPVLPVADCAALVAPIGLFLGRIANFVNAELVGRTTDLPWGVLFPGDHVARHPSQLYEAVLEGPVLAAVLWMAMRRRRLADGYIAGLFLCMYALFRFGVEFTREPDEQLGFVALGWLTMGQLLSAAMAAVPAVIWLSLRRARTARSCRPSSTGAPGSIQKCLRPSPVVERQQASVPF